MTASDGAKLDAVALVAERLERACLAGKHPDRVYCNAGDVARELRSILEFNMPLPAGSTPTDCAFAELGVWSRRHRAATEPGALVAGLLSEASILHQDAGLTLAQHLALCREAWRSMVEARAGSSETG